MSKRILVADDEAHILHVVSLKLRNAGFEVLTAADGEEAAELCQVDPPDLVITDYQMPFLTGVELCKRLRQSPLTRSIPAIMLTARGFDIEPQEMVEAGISVVLAKPFSPRELLERVNDLLHVSGGKPAAGGERSRTAGSGGLDGTEGHTQTATQ